MEIVGHTNVKSLRCGRGVALGVAEPLGKTLVTTMEVPWSVVQHLVGGHIVGIHHVDSMEFDVVEAELAELPDCDTVLAVGGGRAIDFGKFVAWRRGCRLVTLPSALSVDAFVTPAAGLRRGYQVEYVGETSPDPLVIDYDVLRTAPVALNVAGVGDLLSIHTATRDWELAAAAGKSEYPFSKADVTRARAILGRIRRQAASIRSVTDEGLQAIVDGYLQVNTICLPAGHYRVEEGSEHFLFYELEQRLRRPFLHGQIVALGIYAMSRLQRNDHEATVRLMDELGLDYRPQALGIAQTDLRRSLESLEKFVRQQRLWYSIIDEQALDSAWIDRLCADLYAA